MIFVDFKELRELKDIKTWSFDELDDAIGSRKKIIDNLNNDVRKLREVKWQKTCEEMKSKVVDSGIDFSPELLQQFFLKSAEAEAEIKPAKSKSKSSRSKKDATEKTDDKDNDDDAHPADDVVKNSSPEKTATALSSENNSANNVAADISADAVDEKNVPQENFQPEVNVPPKVSEEKTALEEIAVEDAPPTENVEPKNFGNQNTDALNNPDEEIFEEVDSQPKNSTSEGPREVAKKAEVNFQPENSSLKELKNIANYLGLSADASFAEVRRAFEIRKNEVLPTIADSFEKVLGEMEKAGEIA